MPHRQHRLPVACRAGSAAPLTAAAVLAAVSLAMVHAGNLQAGVPYLIAAVLACAVAFLVRLAARLLQVSRALIDQNARLLTAGRADCPFCSDEERVG
jgi:hypothetical protein